MNPIVLSDFPFTLDPAPLAASLHIEPGSEEEASLRNLAAQAQRLGRPKALCGIAFVESSADAAVTVDGITFSSRVMRVNLDRLHRVFPYIATCGMELEAWADTMADPIERYCAESIKQMALGAAVAAVARFLDAQYNPGPTSAMNPGSLADWPLSEQRKLFALCGDVKSLIGVALSPSLLMVPTKSVSGIRFSSEQHFENCQLCPRLDCPNRRMPYDEMLFEQKYHEARA